VSDFGFRVLGLRFRVRLRDRASGSGIGVQGLDQDLSSTEVMNLEQFMVAEVMSEVRVLRVWN
jgi:hypothetical protein